MSLSWKQDGNTNF